MTNVDSDKCFCRLCLVRIEHSYQAYSVFKDKIARIAIYRLLFRMLNINLDPEFTDKICPRCYQKIKDFFDFGETIRQNQSTIHGAKHQKEILEINVPKIPTTPLDVEFLNVDRVDVKTEPMDVADEKVVVIDRPQPPREIINPNRDPTKEKKLQCNHCLYRSFNKKNLQSHLLHMHFQHLKPCYKCDQCDKTFARKSRATEHVAKAHAPEHIPCEQAPECTLTFSNMRAMKSHVIRHHLGIKKVHTCTHCDRTFNASSSLLEHNLRHHTVGGLRYKCRNCGRGFVYENQLIRHVDIVHRSKFPFNCHVCKKGFAENKHKFVHMHKYHKDEYQEMIDNGEVPPNYNFFK